MISEEQVRQLAQERIDEKLPGCYIVNIQVSPSNHIMVELDHEERGVSIAECVQVSRNIEHNLDRETEDFELEVTSAGLDRPIRVWKQYVRHVGKTLLVFTHDNRELKGKLVKAENGVVALQTSRKEKSENGKKKIEVLEEVSLNADTDIREARIVISFK
jgi:ribosome maturation factor RimP